MTKPCARCGNEFETGWDTNRALCKACEREDIEDSIAAGGGDLE